MKRTSEELKKELEKAKEYYKNNEIKVNKLGKLFNIERHILSRYLKKEGFVINPNGKQKINSNIFNKIDSEEKAYWLGFLYADGYVSIKKNTVSLELGLKDKEHLKKFNQFLNKELSIKEDHFRVRCIFQDFQIKKDLIELGCVSQKSLILKFPTFDQVPKDYIHHFIRGYIDGDGSIFITNNLIHLSILGTKEFLESLKEILGYKNQTLHYNNKTTKTNCYFISFCNIKAFSIFNLIYSDSTIFLERKYNKIIEHCRFKEKSLKLLQGKFGEVLLKKLDNTELT
jgi:hypothetical protein